MAVLNAVPGDPLANAYSTVVQATASFTMRLQTAPWTDASVPDQEAALQWATRLIDEQVHWYGVPTYPDQALASHRWGWSISGGGSSVQHHPGSRTTGNSALCLRAAGGECRGCASGRQWRFDHQKQVGT